MGVREKVENNICIAIKLNVYLRKSTIAYEFAKY